MLPYISLFDVLFAVGGVGGLVGLSLLVFAIARAQQPAQRLAIRVAETAAATPVPAAATDRTPAAAG